MALNKDKKLYNYIVNTLGVSKDMIYQVIEDRITDLIYKHAESLLSKGSVNEAITKAITSYVTSGKVDPYFSKKSFEKILDEYVKSAVEDSLRNRGKITLQFKKNSLKFIEDS